MAALALVTTSAIGAEPEFSLPVVVHAAGASSTSAGSSVLGPIDGNRFSLRSDSLWRGTAGESNWWWEARFEKPRYIGAILQIAGDHDFVLRHGPVRYVWLTSGDGRIWRKLEETKCDNETRTFRLHRLKKTRNVLALRLQMETESGEAPVLREVQFFESSKARVAFPPWAVVVNTTHDKTLPGHGQEFIPLARSCAGWTNLQAQQICLETFNETFLAVEPRPLCAFLSGNFKDWCEVDRGQWRGAAGVLRRKTLPMWASCGGAQGLAILAETGVEKPWDCPHCRDPQRPRLPIYTHVGHLSARPCGDYSGCIFERGPHEVAMVKVDPAFAGLPSRFRVMESHCGQIEWAPKGWELIATAGEGTRTRTQCLRLSGRPIYAAQFHIEMAGTPDVSGQIMGNFLEEARRWNDRSP
jgi:hypothetical protein